MINPQGQYQEAQEQFSDTLILMLLEGTKEEILNRLILNSKNRKPHDQLWYEELQKQAGEIQYRQEHCNIQKCLKHHGSQTLSFTHKTKSTFYNEAIKNIPIASDSITRQVVAAQDIEAHQRLEIERSQAISEARDEARKDLEEKIAKSKGS